MLGKTAGGLFWMFRYLERSENIARLIGAGFRFALTHSSSSDDEWGSILTSAGSFDGYTERHGAIDDMKVIDYLLRDPLNSSSVLSMIESARSNARLVRTALTVEVWEAVNECWMALTAALDDPIRTRDVPELLGAIRRQSALVRGALHGTMLRDDIYDFARIGTFLERADSTARILDVKYYVLLPSASFVGSSLDNVQWDTILRSVSGRSGFRRLHGGDAGPRRIANFLILDTAMPRSLAFCTRTLAGNLNYLSSRYGERVESTGQVEALRDRLADATVESIFDQGLHEFLQEFIVANNTLGSQIASDYGFNP